jgi:hypothetical protein
VSICQMSLTTVSRLPKIYLSALCGTQAPDVESDVVMTTEMVQSASRDVDIATLGIVVSSSRRELGKLIIILDRSEKRSNLPEISVPGAATPQKVRRHLPRLGNAT